MSTPLTVEEALALLINMHYIPNDFTVLSMTEVFAEGSAAEYDAYEGDDEDQREALRIRMEACDARHTLALLLKKSLLEEAIYTADTLLECTEESTEENPLITLESLDNWAHYCFGITFPKKTSHAHEIPNSTFNTKAPSWEDVTIKIYADYKLGYAIGNGAFKRASFMGIGLMGTRKLGPNELGGILIGFSQLLKYPSNGIIENKHKTAISKLKMSLIRLTGLSGDPFYIPNKADGYKPKFTLIDDRKNADERAKREAIHVDSDSLYRETDKLEFEQEDDEAAAWLKTNHT